MLYRQPISNEQLAPFLEVARLMTIPVNKVPPLIVKEIPAPSASQNTTILAMNQAMIAQAIKTNTENVKEYEERKELWYRETAIAAYLDVKRKAEEAAAKRKAEEAAVKKKAEEDAKAAAEKENERAMDANSEGEVEVEVEEDEVSFNRGFGIRGRDQGSEGEEKEGEEKGKSRRLRLQTKHGCKVPANAKYQRPCMGDVLMDANDKIFYVRSKNCCFICLLRNNVCSFTREDEAEFIMPEAADDEEYVDEEVEPAEPEDMDEEVGGVRKEVEEVREEDMEDREVEEDETMKDPEADEL
ncbi:hypothetical protein M422DRAFT_240506 [Sphaerobolus stellatus SS14]|nr:hypothetical protein M422DRAFT_240506 [Sphaerobolus stellatus SS14]